MTLALHALHAVASRLDPASLDDTLAIAVSIDSSKVSRADCMSSPLRMLSRPWRTACSCEAFRPNDSVLRSWAPVLDLTASVTSAITFS